MVAESSHYHCNSKFFVLCFLFANLSFRLFIEFSVTLATCAFIYSFLSHVRMKPETAHSRVQPIKSVHSVACIYGLSGLCCHLEKSIVLTLESYWLP